MKKRHFQVLMGLLFYLLVNPGVFAQNVPNIGGGAFWRLGGNNGTAPGSTILGTFGALNQPIFIYTGGTQRGIINNGTGFWGIGNGAFVPSQRLDVRGGNIDVFTPTNGYMINNNFVLWHNGNATDIFVGVGAGISNPTTVPFNTFVGFRSGTSNNAGDSNTFTGASSGAANIGGNANCYYGFQSGFLGNTGFDQHNTMIGVRAGYNNLSEDHTFVGYEAGFSQNSLGVLGNTYVGYKAGHSSLVAGENVFVGYLAGYSDLASTNTFIGFLCGRNNVSGNSNAYLGDAAGITTVSGNFNTYMGASAGTGNISGNSNTSVGFGSGSSTTNDKNTMLGALSNVGATASGNTALGVACTVGANGTTNTAIGISSNIGVNGTDNNTLGQGSTIGTFATGNIAFGSASNVGNNGFNNTTVGQSSTIGGNSGVNTAMGASANIGPNSKANTAVGQSATIGGNSGSNTAVGSATNIGATGSNNIALGANATVNSSLTNASALGFASNVVTNNTMIIGNNNVNAAIGMSGIAGGPTNKLEISYYSNPTPNPTGAPIASTFTPAGTGVATGTSGLQFRDLTDASVQYPYVPNQGFLTVDDNGNVVYMGAPSSSASGIGAGYCPSPTVLTGSAGYDLNNVGNFYFAGNGFGTAVNNVIIGKNCTPPLAKLDVFQNSTTSVGGSIGANIENADQGVCANPVFGLVSRATGTQGLKVASFFQATPAPNCCGSLINYAIYVPQNGGTVALGFPGPISCSNTGPVLNVNGSAILNGSTLWNTSDSTMKKNIKPLGNMLSQVMNLRPVSFQWDTITDTLSYGFHYGFIAQQVNKVLPIAVRQLNGHYHVAYTDLIPVLTSAIQQQQHTIDRDSARIDSLIGVLNSIQTCLSKFCDSTHHSAIKNNAGDEGNSMNVSLSNAAVLYQNTPNPFGVNGTKISYFLPENTQGAAIVFYDMYGGKLREVQLTQTGMGTINVNPDKLSNGVYSYSLVVNGQVVDTKRMVFQK